MDNHINLQLGPTAPQCLECGGPILHPQPPPFRIDFASGAIRNTRRDGDVMRILSGDLCETCRLENAKGTENFDIYSRELTDLRRVRDLLELDSDLPALQRFTWEITDTYPELQGATLISYGMWCLSTEPLPADMRALSYGLENGFYLCIIFALEILSLPDHSTRLHSRWDPDSGEERQEIRNRQPGDLGHRKRLLEAMELIWEARRAAHRPKGSTRFTYDEYVEVFKMAADKLGRAPTSLKEFVDVSPQHHLNVDTVKRNLKEADTTWGKFRKEQEAAWLLHLFTS